MSQINKPTAPLVTIDPDTKADLVNGEVPSEQLPSYVDDVLEFDSVEDFPEEGETGKIYVDLETNYTYRWSGSAYIQVGGGSSGEIEINDYNTAPQDIVNRIKINGENYEVESKYNYNGMQIDVSSSHRETLITADQVQGLIESYGGVVPEYEIPCRFSVLIDEEHQFPPFYGWLFLRRDGDNISAVGIMNEQFDELADLEYDSDAGAFVSHHLFPIQTIVPDFAEYLEQQTGESAPVEEIHDLWLPSQKKFVKFAGSSASQCLHTVIFRKGSQDEEIVYTYYQIQYIENQADSNWMKKLAATVYDATMYDAEDTGTEYKGYINRCAEHNATIQQIRWTGSSQIIINPQGSPFTLLDAYYENNEGKIELHFDNTSLTVMSGDVVAQFVRAFDASAETDEPYWPYE